MNKRLLTIDKTQYPFIEEGFAMLLSCFSKILSARRNKANTKEFADHRQKKPVKGFWNNGLLNL